MSVLSDADLVVKAKAGDSDALELLLRRYNEQLFNYLYRMLSYDKASAEDALQETFVNAIRAMKKYKEQGYFKSWLYKIAHREALRVIRKRKRNISLTDIGLNNKLENNQELNIPDSRPISSEILERKEQGELMDAALMKLPESQREVVLLRLKEELSFKEIAEITNCSINTVLGRMHNATNKLKSLLGEACG